MTDRQRVDLLRPEPEILAAAAEVLRKGGIVVYPTETLYGIGADPRHERALERLQQAKERTDPKPVLLVAASLDDVRPFITALTPEAELLVQAFWPGPLTLLLPASEAAPHGVTRGSGRVGIRVPSSPVALGLARAFGGPVTSTSANTTGHPTPADIDGIAGMLGTSVDLYLDAGPLPPSLPSTVVDAAACPVRLVREGAVSIDRLHAVLPDIQV